MRNKKGFTLVEVIVVLVVLGILASIVIPSLVRYIDKSKQQACIVNRAEALREYTDFIDLFGDDITFDEYAAVAFSTAKELCPAGGTCSFVGGDGGGKLTCSVHDAP